jgi:ribosomal protein S18 acetylase RimI-like enzyme
MRIRPLTSSDLPYLNHIDANFASERFLDVIKTVDGFNTLWQLIEQPLDPPFVSTDYYLDDYDLAEIGERLKRSAGLYLVAEENDQLIAMLDMEHQAWHNAAMLWNIAVDRAFRGRGIGRELIRRAIEWARDHQLRAIRLETQTNNWPACNFYRRLGFQPGGLDDHYYANDDIGVKEVALFWWYEII